MLSTGLAATSCLTEPALGWHLLARMFASLLGGSWIWTVSSSWSPGLDGSALCIASIARTPVTGSGGPRGTQPAGSALGFRLSERRVGKDLERVCGGRTGGPELCAYRGSEARRGRQGLRETGSQAGSRGRTCVRVEDAR